jgi:AcrR family transcriptional regulator
MATRERSEQYQPRHPRQGPGDTTETRVLRAAADIFASHGYHGTSLRVIADVVGIQTASLYHYVDSKQELLTRVMMSALRHRHMMVLDAVEKEPDPASRLRAFIGAHVRYQAESQAEARVCLSEFRSLEPERMPRLLEVVRSHEALLVSILRDGIEKGTFLVDDVSATVQGFLDTWDGVAFWFRPDGEFTSGQLGERYAEFAVRAISRVAPAAQPHEEELMAEEASKRLEIQSAAAELFAEHGYAGTTVRALAARAGVQPSLIYHYFGSKEGLLYAILSEQMRRLIDAVREATSRESRPPEQIAGWVRAHVRTDGTRKHFSIISDAELYALSEPHRAAVVAQRRHYEDLLTGIVEQGRREGLFDVQSTKLVVYAIGRMCSGAGKWGSSSDPARLQELGDCYAELIVRGLGYRSRLRQPVPETSGPTGQSSHTERTGESVG